MIFNRGDKVMVELISSRVACKVVEAEVVGANAYHVTVVTKTNPKPVSLPYSCVRHMELES